MEEKEDRSMTEIYDEFHPAPGRIVHYWPHGQSPSSQPLPALVVSTGLGEAGPTLCVFDTNGLSFESAVPYGETWPADAGAWTWPVKPT